MEPLRLLLMSTPVGPLGSGLGGGVELTLSNLAQELMERGHQVMAIAPKHSTSEHFPILTVSGALQTTAQSQGRDAPITLPANSVLAKMWELGRSLQSDYDLLVNFAYDWLPFYLTSFFERPIAHLVSMGSLTDAMDQAIAQAMKQAPGTIAVHSHAQADTFTFGDQCRVLANGFDLSQYEFCKTPDAVLGWVGRIAPEKGLEDAITACDQIQIPLKIWGAMTEPAYWEYLQATYPNAPISYEGFLSTYLLQQGVRRCRGLLMTPKWVEAFGNVAIEALACGVPVIAYRRGGPAEIVQSGKTGWLVEPDSVAGLVEAIAHLDEIDRHACQESAKATYSMTAMGDRVEAWFQEILLK